jgi:hypothetical protein
VCELNQTPTDYRGVREVPHSGAVVRLTKVRLVLTFPLNDLALVIGDGKSVVVAMLPGSRLRDLAGLLIAAGFTVDYTRTWFSLGLTQQQKGRRRARRDSGGAGRRGAG